MISTPKVIEAIIQSLPNKLDLDIYAENIPDMLPPKISSHKTDESFTPELLICSKDLTHVFSIETEPRTTLTDSFLLKVKLFSKHAQKNAGKLYIVAKSNFISKARIKLKNQYDNIGYLIIQ